MKTREAPARIDWGKVGGGAAWPERSVPLPTLPLGKNLARSDPHAAPFPGQFALTIGHLQP
jgi:hypothetical protein